MDKLIDLLNKYAHTDFVKYEDWCFKEKFMWEEWRRDSDTEVISKDFGFIKWLVDNNKIKDEERQYLWSKDMQSRFSNTNILLMLLAIQDKPIDFLISVLK